MTTKTQLQQKIQRLIELKANQIIDDILKTELQDFEEDFSSYETVPKKYNPDSHVSGVDMRNLPNKTVPKKYNPDSHVSGVDMRDL